MSIFFRRYFIVSFYFGRRDSDSAVKIASFRKSGSPSASLSSADGGISGSLLCKNLSGERSKERSLISAHVGCSTPVRQLNHSSQ
jgi:hypothetical protein